MKTLDLRAKPMSHEEIVAYLLRTHGYGNPEVLRAYLDEVPLHEGE